MLKYTHYQNRFSSKDNGVTHLEGEWSELVEMLTDKSQWLSFYADDKEKYEKCKINFDAFVVAEMRKNAPRTANNVLRFYAIVLDVDDGASYDQVRQDLNKYEYVMYSSGSTGLKNGDRFRVVIPLNTPMDASEWSRYNTSLTERFPYSDQSFKKGIQIQYLPVINTAFEDKFVVEHNKGIWFDYTNQEDLPFVENISLETITANIVYEDAVFTNEELAELGTAIIDHQSGQLSYEERRLLANRLKLVGMNDFDIVQVLDRVQRPGAGRSNYDIVKGANSLYANVEGLYKHIPKGMRITALERRLVRTMKSDRGFEKKSVYDAVWTLKPNQFVNGIENKGEHLSDYADDMILDEGITLINADPAAGKSAYFKEPKHEGKYVFLAPLRAIVFSGGNTKNSLDDGIGTWNQIKSIVRETDKSKFKDKVLVIDEAHGLYSDYGFKNGTINKLIDSFKYFKGVVLMSGTVKPEYFSNIKFDRVYRIVKKLQATKSLRTVFCKSKDDVLIDSINESNVRSIVLVNNKDLISEMVNRINRKCLVITADTINKPEVQHFLQTELMGEYEVLIGTNSIVEGLNINDIEDTVDVFVWGEMDVARIEQVTNRFRNVTTEKRVWILVDRKQVKVMDVYSTQDVINDGLMFVDAIKSVYAKCTNGERFISQYRGEMSKDLIYFHNNDFHLSYTGIDFEHSEYRVSMYENDFSLFAMAMKEFDFNVYSPCVADGDEDKQKEINQCVKAIKEEKAKARVGSLEKLKNDLINNTVDEDTKDGVYDATLTSIGKLLDKGLQRDQLVPFVEGLKEDDELPRKAYIDQERFVKGCDALELIRKHVGTKSFIVNSEAEDIANEVVDFILNQYFDGDVKQMVKSRSWSKSVVLVDAATQVVVNDLNNITKDASLIVKVKTKKVRDVLNQYIKLGKSTTSRVNGDVSRGYPIEALSLTGLTFKRISFDKVVTQVVSIDLI